MELYAVAICETWIYIKCPFNIKQGVHLIPNDDGNLLNRREKVDMTCKKCYGSCFINITDKTERIILKSNKTRTNYLRVKTSLRRQECLYKLQRNNYILNKNNNKINPLNNYKVP